MTNVIKTITDYIGGYSNALLTKKTDLSGFFIVLLTSCVLYVVCCMLYPYFFTKTM
jgi:hypothetical protein